MSKNMVVEIMKNAILSVVFFVMLWIFRGRIESSTMQYVLAFCVLAALFLFDVFVIKISDNKNKINLSFLKSKAASIIVFILSLALFAYIDIDSKGMLGRMTAITPVKNYLLALVFSMVLIVAYKYLKKYPRVIKIFANIIFVVIMIVCSMLYFRPYNMNDVYNFEAYWLNVSSVYEGVPFSVTNVSFYGHYAILLMPFFKLFGLNIYTVQVTQVFGVAIVILSLFYAIETLTKKESSKFFAKALVCCFFVFSESLGTVYPQGIPHRLVFVSIIMSLAIKYIFSMKHKRLFKAIIDVLCCLSIIWNLETGVVMTLAWAITKCVVDARNKKIISLFLYGCRYVIGAVITFVAAWFGVSTVNRVIYGGEFLSLDLFIYPLGTDYVSGIGSEAHFSDFIWILVLGIFVFSFVFALRRVFVNKADKYLESVLMISLSSIMLFPYFYNRAAYFNLVTVSYMQLVLIGLIFCVKLKNRKNGFAMVAHVIGLYVAVLLITNNISNCSSAFSKRICEQRSAQYQAFVEEIEAVVPENAVFYGTGSSYYAMSIENTGTFPCNSVNFTSEGLQKTKEYFDKAETDIVIIGNDDYVKGFMEFWGGISLENLEQNYQVEDVTLSQEAGGIQLKVLRAK